MREQPLQPLQMTTAAIVWDTTGFGAVQPYRIYVVLNGDMAVQDEIYPAEKPLQTYPYVDLNGKQQTLPPGLDPGQNNEGFGLATVMAPAPSPGLVAGASSCGTGAGADVSLPKGSVAACDVRDGTLQSNVAFAALGQPPQLRVTVYSDQPHRKCSHLLVYDGEPCKGGTLIAHKRVHSGNPQGTHAWIDWLPRTVGLHKIVAHVIQDHDDPVPTNHEDTILVHVQKEQQKPKAPGKK